MRDPGTDAVEHTRDPDVASHLEELADPNPDVRRAAIEALGRIQAPGALAALAQAVTDRDSTVRRVAVNALGNHGEPSAVKALSRTLADPDLYVRRAAARKLRARGDPGAIRALVEAMADPNPEVRQLVIWALRRKRDRAVTASLVRAVADADPRVSQAAADALQLLPLEPLVAEELVALLAHPDHRVCRVATRLLTGAADAATVSHLVAILSHVRPTARRAAAEALRGTNDPTAVAALVAAVADRDPEVRRAAANSLRRTSDPAAPVGLVRAIVDSDPQVRAIAVEGLSNTTDALAVAGLLKAMEHTSAEVRCAAAEALRGTDDPVAVRQLAKAVNDPDTSVRKAAVTALDNTTDSVAVAALTTALDAADLEVRRSAAEALAKTDDRMAVRRLAKVIADPHSGVRQVAKKALYGTSDPVAVATLVEALRHSNPDVRRTAAEALSGTNDPTALAPLVKAVLDPRTDVGEAAARALRGTSDPAAVAGIVAMLKHHASSTRSAAALALHGNRNRLAVSALIGAVMKDPDPEVQYHAASALVASGRPRAVATVVNALAHPDPSIRSVAEWAFRHNLHEPRTMTALIAALGHPNPGIRIGAARALGHVYDPEMRIEIRIALERLGNDVDTEVRRVALEALRPRFRPLKSVFLSPFAAISWQPIGVPKSAIDQVERARREKRYVNVCLTPEPDRDPLPRDGNLAPDQVYFLRLDVGPLSQESVTENAPEHPFPDDLLERREHWLDIMVTSDDFEVAAVRHRLLLPVQGRTEYLFVELHTPVRPGPASARVLVFCENNCLQSQVLTAYVGSDDVGLGHGYWSIIDYVLTANLDQVDQLPKRDLALLTSVSPDGSFRLVANSRVESLFSASLNTLQAAEAMDVARTALVHAHFDVRGKRPVSRYDAANVRSAAGYMADLAALAEQGWALYQALISDAGRRRELRRLLARAAGTSGRPASIQICNAGSDPVVFPWQLVYDIPCSGHPPRFTVCPTLQDWRSASVAEPPTRCPHEHGRNTLCPFGFWGFAHIIEVPPSSPGNERALVVSNLPRDPTAAVALSLELDQDLTRRHLDRIGQRMEVRPFTSSDEFEGGLLASDLDVVYFYCHGKRLDVPGGHIPTPVLEIGSGDQVTPTDIGAWMDDWPPDHWDEQRPLVVMNGCHTSELTPAMLVNFVTTFEGARAAGAIGTEVALTQPVANEAMESFLSALVQGNSVGDAIRRMRWELLRKGNIMGLSYSPYVSAKLTLRPPVDR